MVRRPVAPKNGPGQGFGFRLRRGSGDLQADGLELAEVGAELAVAVGFSLVPAGSGIGEPGGGTASSA